MNFSEFQQHGQLTFRFRKITPGELMSALNIDIFEKLSPEYNF